MTKFLSKSSKLLQLPKVYIFVIISLITLQGCRVPTKIAREKAADVVAQKGHFEKRLVKGGEFIFTTYQKNYNPNSEYVFYIEGDGLISINKTKASIDPTPKDPMVLRLASIDKRDNVVYIARPCQYTDMSLNPKCNISYWTNKRFSKDSVYAMNEAINSISKGKKINLVGFSGGGGMAVLIAAINQNVKTIITLSGNLNMESFNQYHKAPKALGSLNPIDYAKKIAHIPQLHLSGELDIKVPAFIGHDFTIKANSTCVKHRILPAVKHNSGWDVHWSKIYQESISCQ